jgi:lipoprotein-anchoring transpeptidase ErfK/SrfK
VVTRRAIASVAAIALAAAFASAVAAAGGAAGPTTAFPAAGELVRSTVARTAPRPDAPIAARMPRFRPDAQFAIVLALTARRGVDGDWWYRVSLPGRPNGNRGWIPADAAAVHPVTNRIVVHRAARQLEVRRVRDGKVLLRTIVAVGRPGAETPLGSDFYVASAFVPTDPFFGSFALETSAYSRLTDWPDDGVVGIHGTDRPALIGQAVSHGCVRVTNDVALRLRRLAPLGTPIDIVP